MYAFLPVTSQMPGRLHSGGFGPDNSAIQLPFHQHSNACFNPMGSWCEDQRQTPNSCGHLDGHLGFNQEILPDLRDKISCSFVSSINSRGLFSYFLSHAHLRPEKPRCWASMHTHWKPRWLLSQVMLLDLKFFFTGKSD